MKSPASSGEFRERASGCRATKGRFFAKVMGIRSFRAPLLSHKEVGVAAFVDFSPKK